MTDKIRIAVAGLGWVAQNRHVPALLRNPAYELVGVIDRHVGRAAKVAAARGLSFLAETSDLAKVDWLDAIDAIAVGAPPAAHAPLVCAALERGKHVLTEKPFAVTLADGQAMAEAAQKSGKILAVVHNFQFSRAAQKLKADLEEGALGPLTRIAAVQWGNPARRLPEWYESLPLGLFFDESPHFFYLLRALAGGALSLQNAQAVASRKGKKTPALAHLLYRGADGLPVTIDCAFESALSEWHVVVTGEKKVAILDIFRDIYLCLPNDGTHAATDILRTSLLALSQHAAQYIPNGIAFLRGRLDYGNDEVFGRFARAIRSGRPPPDIGATDALDVLRLQTQAISALQETL